MPAPLRHLLILGDSISAGIGDPVNGQPVVNAGDLVAQVLRRTLPDLLYTNLAVRGLRISEVREGQLQTGLELNPDLVSIVAGGNDILKGPWNVQHYEEQLELMVRSFASQGAHTLLSTWPDFTRRLSLSTERRERMAAQLQEGNAATRRVAERHGSLLVEFYGSTIDQNPQLWSRDGVHPNALGYRALAQLLLDTFSEPLGFRKSFLNPLVVRGHQT